MAFTISSCQSREKTSRQSQGPRCCLMLIMGLLLHVVRPETMLEDMSLRGSATTDSNWGMNKKKALSKHTGGAVVPKTVISSKLRMSILVGLEGSGHHYLMKVADKMFETNDEISQELTRCIASEPYFTEVSMEESMLLYTNLVVQARAEMHNLANQEQSLSWPGHLARLCCEISYPIGIGGKKVLHYLDLRTLAEIAEEAGVDLRVVYLKRSAHDLFVANTMHRPFQDFIGLDLNTTSSKRFSEYALVLFTDSAVMHSSLAEIDPAFIVCHDFARAGEEEQASRVANFVAPNAEMAKMYRRSLLDNFKEHAPKFERLPIEGAETMVARLQHKLNTFESSLCG